MNLNQIVSYRLIEALASNKDCNMAKLPNDQRQFFLDYFTTHFRSDLLTESLFTRICPTVFDLKADSRGSQLKVPEKIDLRKWTITWKILDLFSNPCAIRVLMLDVNLLASNQKEQKQLAHILGRHAELLQELTLEQLSMKKECWNSKIKFNSLTHLSLKKNSLVGEDLKAILVSMPALRFLDLERSQYLSDKDIRKAAVHLADLQGLNVSGTFFTLKSLNKLNKKLIELTCDASLDFSSLVNTAYKLRFLKLINYSFKILKEEGSLDIESLFLEDCYFSTDNDIPVRFFSRFRELKQITFAFNRFRKFDDLVHYINRLPLLSRFSNQLESISLIATQEIDWLSFISEEEERVFAFFKGIKNIHLENIAFPFDLKFDKTLESLSLINSKITSSAFQSILTSSVNIKRLIIEGGTASTATLESLFFHPPKFLQTLYFDGTPQSGCKNLDCLSSEWIGKIRNRWPEIEVTVLFTKKADLTMTQEIA